AVPVVAVPRSPAGTDAVLADVAGGARVAVVARRMVGLEPVGGTRRRRSVAELGEVALPRRRTAWRAGRLHRRRRTVRAGAVTRLGDVAEIARVAAHAARRELIRRTEDVAAGARLGRIANACRRPAHRPRVARGVDAFIDRHVAGVDGAWIRV